MTWSRTGNAARLLAVLAGTAAMGAVSPSVLAADAAAGQAVFKANCAMCHSTEADKTLVGPSLFGIVGRHSGSEPGFHYSAANLAAKLVWNEATLDRYITAPQKIVPGTIMPYPGLPDAAKRADLIAYLATLK